MYINNLIRTIVLPFFFILFSLTTIAQPPSPNTEDDSVPSHQTQNTYYEDDMFSGITDNDLKKYAIIGAKIQDLQMESLEKIDSIIEQSGIGWHRYQAMADYNSKVSKEDSSFTVLQMEKFKSVNKKIEEIQEQLQEKNRNIAMSHGMSMRRFLIITDEIQRDEDLYERFKRIQESVLKDE
jgi:hypothetical protein